MSRDGLVAAAGYGLQLPQFASQKEAEETLFQKKDAALRALEQELQLDYSPASLKALEAWYFEQTNRRLLQNEVSLEVAVAMYYGEVFCRNSGFKWIVEEFVFAPGRYNLGVTKGYGTLMFTNGKYLSLRGNKRMQSMYRDYMKYSSIDSSEP